MSDTMSDTSDTTSEDDRERGGFGRVLRAEWTKFRTVRGWVVGILAAAAAILGFGLVPGQHGSCGAAGTDMACGLPVGPEGQEVTDTFYFVHRPLDGDGSITVRVASLTGELPPGPRAGGGQGGPGPAPGPVSGDGEEGRPGLAPWAKAGLIVKAGTASGSSYAAVMLTGAHGARMQYDFTHDVAGSPGLPSAGSPRWLRLTRSGDTVTGYESADGASWTALGSARLEGLPTTVQAGLFAASPPFTEAAGGILAGAGVSSGPSLVTAAFDRVDADGAWAGGDWAGERIGGTSNMPQRFRGGFEQAGDGLTVTGSGDLAPAVSGGAGLGTSVTQTLAGTFVALIAVVVVGTMLFTAEFRRGLILATLAASPGRGRVLAAKAVVLGAVTFVTGVVAAAVVVTAGQGVLRDAGVYVHPVTTGTELRLIAGTAALLAVAAVLALAIGALLRRGAAAVAAVLVVIVLPYLLAVSILPAGVGDWLLRVTPAAAFALQQSAAEYFQVDNVYNAASGYFPLAPWAGFAVLCAWAAVALGLAALSLRRRDA